jgi:hypothetical protein
MPESGGERVEWPRDRGPFLEGNAKLTADGKETWYGKCVQTTDRGEFYNVVVASQKALAASRGDLVLRDGDGYRIDLSRSGEYVVALSSKIVQMYGPLIGVCATPGGPEDEIGIKNTNSSSEQYDVVVSNGKIWANKTVRCAPARF